jgi:cell division protein ZapE
MRPAITTPVTMNPMTPLARYQLTLERDGFAGDPIQLAAITKLDEIYRGIMIAPKSKSVWSRLLSRPSSKQPVSKGLYLWGGVGRGKTFVVDTFYACLPEHIARRVHFHSFMRGVHRELKAQRGTIDPLRQIAARWAQELRVLCLDEFHVLDITDAMLLTQLLMALFDAGVILVTTSNEAPDMLYKGGLQRERFLPAIALLKSHLDVFEFSGRTDYRLRTLTQAATYYSPNDANAEAALRARYIALTHDTNSESTLLIDGRQLTTRAHFDGVAWFDFAEICGGPRGTADYIEIACCFHTVLISNAPHFGDDDNDAARRFINLVDEFYDRGVNLLMSAADAPNQLYRGTRLLAPFARTVSRLTEMQSEQYLARPHLSS